MHQHNLRKICFIIYPLIILLSHYLCQIHFLPPPPPLPSPPPDNASAILDCRPDICTGLVREHLDHLTFNDISGNSDVNFSVVNININVNIVAASCELEPRIHNLPERPSVVVAVLVIFEEQVLIIRPIPNRNSISGPVLLILVFPL